MEKTAIILAAGKSQRFQNEVPKQFVELNGLPIIAYSIIAFKKAFPDVRILLVLHPSHVERWKNWWNQSGLSSEHQIVQGGETRFHSVQNALQTIGTEGIIAVHDAARPLVEPSFIQFLFKHAAVHGSSVPTLSTDHALLHVVDSSIQTVDRSHYQRTQTPQCFWSQKLKAAYRVTPLPHFSDDAAVFLHAGEEIHLVPGLEENIKITYPIDFLTVKAYLNQTSSKK